MALSRRFAAASLFVFPLAGPAAVLLAMSVPLAVAGLFSLGPGGLLYYLMLATWWLPGLYVLLAPPFFLSAIGFGIAAWPCRTSSVSAALLSTEIAFFAYFAFWHFMPGGLDIISHDYANLRPGFLRSPGAVLVVLVATAACWWIVRRAVSRDEPALASAAPAWDRTSSTLAVAVVLGAMALAALPAMVPLPVAEAWRYCSDTTARGAAERIRGCTDIIRRAGDQPVERLVTAHLRRGAAYSDLGHGPGHADDLLLAIADFTEAIRLDPNGADAYLGRGLSHARRNDDDRAIADLDMAQRLDARRFEHDAHRLFRARGLALARKGEYDRAIADHTSEIAQAPRFADGYLHRVAAYLGKGDSDRSIADFSEAVRIEPFRAAGYIGRGFVHLAQGDQDRAAADFDEAIRRQPKLRLTAPAYRGRGLVLERKGELAAALAAFETTVSLEPLDRDAHAGRERVRAALKR